MSRSIGRRVSFLLVLVAVATLVTGCGKTTPPIRYGSVEGYVYMPDGVRGRELRFIGDARTAPEGYVPAPEVSVTCTNCDSSATTDDTGRFRLTGVKEGFQTVTATIEGYLPVSARVNVLANQVNYLSSELSFAKQKEWTYLVYMAADNDLETYAMEDINEMERVGSTEDVNILVQVDRSPGHDSSDGDWTGTRRYYITRDNNTTAINSILVQDMGEAAMDSPETLADFIRWGMEHAPSQRVALVLWNHGSGVYPRSIDRSTPQSRGICWDDTSGGAPFNCLTTDEIADALNSGLTGQPAGRKIDILDFDACLMQMVEVGYEIQPYVRFMVGSQEVTPGTGNPYDTVLSALTASPDMTTDAFAKSIVDCFAQEYEFTWDTTHSVIDLSSSAWSTLISRIDALAGAITAEPDLTRVRCYSGDFCDTPPTIWSHNTLRFDFREVADLYWFADRIANDGTTYISGATKSAAASLCTAVQSAVAYKRNTGYFKNAWEAKGLSILLPRGQFEWQPYSDGNQYAMLAYSRQHQWDEALAALRPYPYSTGELQLTLSWMDDDLDLVVWEPNAAFFSAYFHEQGQVSTNGVFSWDARGLGANEETYTLRATHEQGLYLPIVVNNSYFNKSFTLTVDDGVVSTDYTATVPPGEAVYWESAGTVRGGRPKWTPLAVGPIDPTWKSGPEQKPLRLDPSFPFLKWLSFGDPRILSSGGR